MTYAETLDFLFTALPVFQREGASAYKPGLDNTLSFAALLGDPHKGLRAVHVAGTNGKGSTSHMLASVLQAAGYRTGLFTSPHLKDFRERIRIDGQMIPESEVVGFVERYRVEMTSSGLTFFEMCTLLAFDWFARSGVDIAVIETGLGGRLDATNIVTPGLSIITNIGLDHTDLLGPTLPEIAAEKAGIVKPGVPVVIGAHDAAVDAVFVEKAAAAGSRLVFADDHFAVTAAEPLPDGQRLSIQPRCGDACTLELDLPGDYQRHNVLTVLAACRELGLECGPIGRGLRDVRTQTGLRGRWQILGHDPLTVCDTGHNAHGLREVVAQIARQDYRRLYFIIGVVGDKDLDSILPLLPRGAYYIFTQPSPPRARDRHSLAAAASAYGLHGQTSPTVGEALSAARALAGPGDMIFIGGSTYTVADLPEL